MEQHKKSLEQRSKQNQNYHELKHARTSKTYKKSNPTRKYHHTNAKIYTKKIKYNHNHTHTYIYNHPHTHFSQPSPKSNKKHCNFLRTNKNNKTTTLLQKCKQLKISLFSIERHVSGH
eukprot:c5818_g1_i1.p2 GENE.c5818_g1_i1~~c5818_g1_i1.p2  ORF type:complete len:118 (+),score=19.98 c5818_g1_i1:103-456(+)